jgi:hypothetical protein
MFYGVYLFNYIYGSLNGGVVYVGLFIESYKKLSFGFNLNKLVLFDFPNPILFLKYPYFLSY